MNYKEYGAGKPETILLLHGGGLSWWNYREAAEMLQTDYHVVLPILDGHAGSDRPFTSIEENAAEIISFIDGHLNGSVSLLGGLSLGGQIALEVLAQRKGLCRCALIESAMVLPSKLTHALIAPAFGGSYGLMRSKGFARLQFHSLHMKQALFDDYYRDTCAIAKADMIAFLKANTAYSFKDALVDCRAKCHVFIGEKENRSVWRSARLLREKLSTCTETVLPGLYHGEFSINRPRDYAEAVRRLLQ